jgi:hypothetical protein
MEYESKSKIKHFYLISGIAVLMLLGMLYPFMPARFDPLAVPLSNVIQMLGLAALPCSFFGLFWMLKPGYRPFPERILLVTCFFVLIILSLIAWFSGGKIFALLILSAGIYLVTGLKKISERKTTADTGVPKSFALYVISLPVLILIMQLALAKTVSSWSRNRAIVNAGEYIAQLKSYHEKYGKYPETLQAMYKDYDPHTAGIEKYHYFPHKDSYNLSFEQPRFLLDNIGTREWLVYSPDDDHKVYSHTSWFLLLTPEVLEQSQGWYASGNTEHPHWKYFLFD